MANEPCAYYKTAFPLWLCEFITGARILQGRRLLHSAGAVARVAGAGRGHAPVAASVASDRLCRELLWGASETACSAPRPGAALHWPLLGLPPMPQPQDSGQGAVVDGGGCAGEHSLPDAPIQQPGLLVLQARTRRGCRAGSPALTRCDRSGVMSAAALLHWGLGALGVISVSEPQLQVVTEGGDKQARARSEGREKAGAGTGVGTAAAPAGAVRRGGLDVTEMTPLLTTGGGGAMEGVRAKPPSKDDDRACSGNPALLAARG